MKCIFLLVCQHCQEDEERPSCDRGVWWRGSAQKVSKRNRRPQATASRGKYHHSCFFFLLTRVLFGLSLRVKWQQHWRVDDLPTGFFSHTDHSDREEGPLPAAPRKGSASERTRGQNQKLDQTARHQLKPDSCSQGKYDTEKKAVVAAFSTLNWSWWLIFCLFKKPKRRVTWGGKMLRLARGGSCDLSLAEPFSRKKKADRSCLMELAEGKKNLYAKQKLTS